MLELIQTIPSCEKVSALINFYDEIHEQQNSSEILLHVIKIQNTDKIRALNKCITDLLKVFESREVLFKVIDNISIYNINLLTTLWGNIFFF